jgi:hypothetical protein
LLQHVKQSATQPVVSLERLEDRRLAVDLAREAVRLVAVGHVVGDCRVQQSVVVGAAQLVQLLHRVERRDTRPGEPSLAVVLERCTSHALVVVQRRRLLVVVVVCVVVVSSLRQPRQQLVHVQTVERCAAQPTSARCDTFEQRPQLSLPPATGDGRLVHRDESRCCLVVVCARPAAQHRHEPRTAVGDEHALGSWQLCRLGSLQRLQPTVAADEPRRALVQHRSDFDQAETVETVAQSVEVVRLGIVERTAQLRERHVVDTPWLPGRHADDATSADATAPAHAGRVLSAELECSAALSRHVHKRAERQVSSGSSGWSSLPSRAAVDALVVCVVVQLASQSESVHAAALPWACPADGATVRASVARVDRLAAESAGHVPRLARRRRWCARGALSCTCTHDTARAATETSH